MVKSKKVSDEVLEKIANDTYQSLMGITKISRPKKIFLCGADLPYLIKVRHELQKKFDDSVEIFIGRGGYSVNVGQCINYYLKS